MKKGKIAFISALLLSVISLTGCRTLNYEFLRSIETIFSSINEPAKQPTKIIAPESIDLNLSQDFQKYINASLDTGENDKSLFTYVSSNSDVVSVNKYGLLTPVSDGDAQITVTYSKNGVNLTTLINVNVKSENVSDYTIMLYMCASDLEYSTSSGGGWGYSSGPGLFSEDIKEILGVKGLNEKINIIIETGGTKKWFLPSTYLDGATEISSTNLQRWKVENNKLKLVSTLDTNYMAKESSFEDFLKWGLLDYPAKQMGVVLSSHGAGIAGCAFDDNYTYTYAGTSYQHTLRTYEVAEAAKNALESSSRNKFTWIGYDCCLMQCGDVASINADYFEYMVASQESESGDGWNHDYYLPYLVANPNITPLEFLPRICDAFLSQSHSDRENSACLQTLSVLDLTKMNEFTESFNSLCNTYIGTSRSSFNNVKYAFKASYNSFGEGCYGLCDFESLLNKLKDYFFTINLTNILSKLHEVVIYNKYCSKYTTSICGLNAFVPCRANTSYSLQVGKEDYANTLSTKFTDWQTLCVNNGEFGWDSI